MPAKAQKVRRAVLAGTVCVLLAGTGLVAARSSDNLAVALSGQASVRTASVLIVESAKGVKLSLAGEYDFETGFGRFQPGSTNRSAGYSGPNEDLIGHGKLFRPGYAVWEGMKAPKTGVQGILDLQPPRPLKPWVSTPVGSGADPMAVVLFGLPAQPSPVALANTLQRQAISQSRLGVGRLGGVPVAEYRLVLGLGSLAKSVASSDGTLQVLGPHHPVFIWVDQEKRLVQLQTSVLYNWSQLQTITLRYSRFNHPVTVKLPPSSSVETMQQYQQAITKSWGCPPNGRCQG